MSVNPSLVHNSRWSVAAFEDDDTKIGNFYSVEWWFRRTREVEATGQWYGEWIDIGINKARLSIKGDNWTDDFEVCFLNPRRFIALKGGDLYRIGRRIWSD